MKTQLHYFKTIDSTNNYLKNLSPIPKNIIPVCVADTQTAGRGRLDKNWLSPAGENLYLSLLWRTNQSPQQYGTLGLMTAISIIQALEPFNLNILIKWPNDLLINQKKLAGILIESIQKKIIIGIGLNINMTENRKIGQPWTSLQKELHQTLDISQISEFILTKLLKNLNQFELTGFANFKNLYPQYDALLNKTININISDQTFTGQAVGINQYGELQLKLNSEIKSFSSGSISIPLRV